MVVSIDCVAVLCEHHQRHRRNVIAARHIHRPQVATKRRQRDDRRVREVRAVRKGQVGELAAPLGQVHHALVGASTAAQIERQKATAAAVGQRDQGLVAHAAVGQVEVPQGRGVLGHTHDAHIGHEGALAQSECVEPRTVCRHLLHSQVRDLHTAVEVQGLQLRAGPHEGLDGSVGDQVAAAEFQRSQAKSTLLLRRSSARSR